MNEQIKKLVEKYPNDMELGEAVRALYWKQIKNKPVNETTDTEKTLYWNQTSTADNSDWTIHWDEAVAISNKSK